MKTLTSLTEASSPAAAFLFLLFGLFGCAVNPESEQGEEHQEIAGHTESHQDDKEGDDEEGHEEGVIELSPEKAAAIGIAIGAVEKRSIGGEIVTTGQVDFEQSRLAHVSPRISGRVHEVRASLGDRVQAGQTLAILDSIELGRAKALYVQAKVRGELAHQNFEREQTLFADRITSEGEMLQAKSAHLEAEAELKQTKETLFLYGLSEEDVSRVAEGASSTAFLPLRAPLAGKIVEKHLTIGELVTPERNLYTIADLGHVWIWIDVFEGQLRNVHIDDGVRVEVDAFPDLLFEGKVTYVSDQVDTDTRTVRARVDVENPGEYLRPGMFAQVWLTDPHRATTSSGATSLAVPESAVQRDGESTVVYVMEEPNHFRRVSIETGLKSGGLVEVLAGLDGTERVVVEGTFLLKSELSSSELGGGHEH
jgi:cobalt-zinc-cadmium efflux system membrane fusion protein